MPLDTESLTKAIDRAGYDGRHALNPSVAVLPRKLGDHPARYTSGTGKPRFSASGPYCCVMNGDIGAAMPMPATATPVTTAS